jgi:hypothetical protein
MRPLVDAGEALVAPPTLSVDAGRRAGMAQQLTADIGSVMAVSPSGGPLVVSLPVLRQARNRPESVADSGEPFAWKPAFVRRSLGLAALDACAAGRFRTPGQAVGPVAGASVARWEETGWRTFHWEPWFAGLAPGARAMVLAEAVGWATAVWSSFDWEVPLGAGAVALVSVSSGCPGELWAEELAYLALVAALRRPSRPVPARVLGLWLDAGAQCHVEIGAEILTDAAARVVSTVTAMVEARAAEAT